MQYKALRPTSAALRAASASSAREFGAQTWAQFFLKFAASHPAVTVVTPATGRPHHMVDNMTAARGRLPDERERRRMVELIDSLPS